ncbi:Gfo/Idh/MocA family protein [Deminuibacter soli]|uniref:Gfo/Idh/MocA family oxidoreductase n=1 Tax=Deminuibacter soli TaxID=2291815 RepID=A0A3E1NHW2_9BACT|nr:Gfo/Idh/MocA family oxidoreductase [Deminuibacter soli]RFM27526.1 gfo/Idh/MocA family oxidoreductase [Deminuibacter soli]
MQRRNFIKNSALAAAGIGASSLTFPLFGRNLAPNEKVLIGVMGTNGRGLEHIKAFTKIPNVEIGFICDVEDGARAKGINLVEKLTGKKPAAIKDFRQVLDNKDVDALAIAAPDHWHAPAAILACAAGKHVYVEKPCSHNPAEGELLIKAARKFNRHVQMGNQRRSMPHLIDAMQQLRNGAIGNVYFGKAWYTNSRKPIGTGKVIPVPANLDWDLWQGPAPREDYRDNLVHYNWHWFWNWGTGEACNNGTHEIDCMRWALGVDYPTRVVSAGGRYTAHDDWQTPDTQVVTYEFGPGKSFTWESRSCNNYPVEGSGRGFIIYGEKGTLVNNGGDDYTIYDEKNKMVKQGKDAAVTDTINPLGPGENLDGYHFRNFIDAVRKDTPLNAEIAEGHKSVLLCHLGNISQRTGRALNCDTANGGKILHDKDAQHLWSRAYQSGWEPKV